MRTLIGLSCLALALAADEGSKHYHGGKLSKYEIGPPALLLSESDEARLRSGRASPPAEPEGQGDAAAVRQVQEVQAALAEREVRRLTSHSNRQLGTEHSEVNRWQLLSNL
mgnify:CR=1 FL=1